jgi:hypothetical protein
VLNDEYNESLNVPLFGLNSSNHAGRSSAIAEAQEYIREGGVYPNF